MIAGLLAHVALLSSCGSDDASSPGPGGTAGSGGTGATGGGGTAGSGGTGGSAGAAGAAGAAGVADTWTNFAQGFFATYCIECHGAGDALRDYSTIGDVIRDKDSIRCGVASAAQTGCGSWPPPKQFPIDNATQSNPKPADAERDRIVAWIEAGLPE